ncbi:MAG: phytanoyl-CoA dioxygenase family protein [Anderseniella sp.]
MTKSNPMRAITEKEIATYQQDGVVCMRELFSPEWVSSLREAAERSMQQPGELHAELAAERKETGRFFHDTFIWMRDDTCRDFVFNSPAGAAAARLMRSDKVNIFFDQWLIKEPGTTTKTPWHHDMTYWPIDGDQISTLWLALDPVTKQTGAVEYVKGSHNWRQKFKPASFSGTNQYREALPDVPNIDSMRGELEFVQFDLQPGDCTLHHGLTVHGAPGNQSGSHRRRAHVSRWAGDDVTFSPRDGLQEMPPLPDLTSGDPIDSDLWPRVVG